MTTTVRRPAGGVQLVVSDLDGTLWELDHELHAHTTAALPELERRGIPLLVATGRRVARAAAPLAAFGLAPPAVCLNGALGLDLATGVRFHRATIAADVAVEVLAAFRAEGVQPCVYVDRDDVSVYVGDSPSTHPEHLASFGADVATDDLARVVAEEAVLGFSVLGSPQPALVGVHAALATVAVAHLAPERALEGFTLTVAGPGMSKWEGVLAYCRTTGIDPGAVLAIGDGPNDLELLTGAAIGIAMADADPLLVAAADHVVGPAVTGGWAELLDLL
ncbi:MAG: HAD hydrolase family protein [Acidimicrobiia bacterium]|nr:HAD hydrolase family protein [Acidimicrobiia bacterium]